MLAVPISFVSEHIETLEEMDMEYRELAMESGIQRCDCAASSQHERVPYSGGSSGHALNLDAHSIRAIYTETMVSWCRPVRGASGLCWRRQS